MAEKDHPSVESVSVPVWKGTEREPEKPAALSPRKKGRLKIFFGYAAGTGKTYSMLEAGQEARKKGVDVVIGYLEPHERPETLAQAKGMEVIAPAVYEEGALRLREMDLDAVLKRRPQLVLADELAHTNARGSRHHKRYQDIQELLYNGIDVYTTLNVQHLESLNDLVASITGILVSERIPDDVFDLADQVELVDIEVQDLLERLREGKVYRPEQAKLASQNFFTLDNLRALREIAMRRCADRVSKISPNSKARDHVLVCLSSSPSNASIIRSAARMASAFDARFSALYIQTPDSADMEEDDAARLQENMRLANRLGASIESAYGDDIAEQIGEFARLSRASKIVIGRQGKNSAFLSRAPLAEKLAQSAPNAEIFIIPDPDQLQKPAIKKRRSFKKSLKGLWIQVLIVLAALVLGLFFQDLGFSEANILAVFVFAVLLCAIHASALWQAVLSALACIGIFGFLFAAPAFSMDLIDKGYFLTFLLLMATAVLTARISIRQKREAGASAAAAANSSLLYEAGQNLQEMDDDETISQFLCREVAECFGYDVVFYPNENGSLGKPVFSGKPEVFLNTREQAVALWTLKNNKRAGAGTDTLSAANGLYLAIRHGRSIYGVLGLDLQKKPLSMEQNMLLLSLLGQAALAMENIANAREKEKAALCIHQEKIKASLLRSISHDLRTPLTTISASADLLLHKDCDAKAAEKLERSIYEDSIWLKDIVENLLSLTRLEEDGVKINRELLDLEEVAEEAMKHVSARKSEHPITVNVEEMAFARLDGKLIVQMLVNLLNNAILHTPAGTPIELDIHKKEHSVIFEVKDAGQGFGEKEKEHLFEPFALSHSKIADRTRSMGLGLSLVKSIVDVHEGTIELKEDEPGAWFVMTLPDGMRDDETFDFEH